MPLIIPTNPGGITNLGSLSDAHWTGISGTARITNWQGANYAGMPNGQSFNINRDGGGVTAIALSSAQNTRDLIVTQINTVMGGAPVAVNQGSGFRVVGAHSIVVSGVSDALFAFLGLPNETRTDTDNLTAITLPVQVVGDEGELVSSALAVPAGANRVTVWIKQTNTGNYQIGSHVLFAWGNGVNDASRILTTASAPSLAVADGTLITDGTDVFYKQQKVGANDMFFIGSNPNGICERVVELTVPSFATSLYIIAGAVGSETTTTPPAYPPTLSCKVGFGTR